MATTTFIRRMALCLNVIVFLVGVTICVCGFHVRFNSGLIEPDVITLFNYIEYSNFRVGATVAVIDYFMICVGGLLAFTAVLGFVAAWKKIKVGLVLYVIIVIVVILLQASTVGLWLSVRGNTDEWLKGRMLQLLQDYKGPYETDEVSAGWNTLFIKGRCCAVNAYGNGVNDFADLPSFWWPRRTPSNNIPPTCCQGVTAGTVSAYDNTASCTHTPSNYYTQGAWEVVTYYVDTFSIVTSVAAAVLLLVQVTAVICSCLLLDRTKNRIGEGGRDKKAQRPPPYVGIDAVMKKRSR